MKLTIFHCFVVMLMWQPSYQYCNGTWPENCEFNGQTYGVETGLYVDGKDVMCLPSFEHGDNRIWKERAGLVYTCPAPTEAIFCPSAEFGNYCNPNYDCKCSSESKWCRKLKGSPSACTIVGNSEPAR